MSAALLFPPEIFVDQVLVTVRDSNVRISGSVVPFHEHARQAAGLARSEGASDALVGAALLYGIGEVLVRCWERHPSVRSVVTPTQAAVAHLSLHLPAAVTEPIRLLPQARVQLQRDAGRGLVASRHRPAFENQQYAAQAMELAQIDRRAGTGPMITPELCEYRDLLAGLCAQPAPALI